MYKAEQNEDGTYNYIVINGDEKGKIISNSKLINKEELLSWNNNMETGLYVNGNIKRINNLDYIEVEERTLEQHMSDK